MAAVMRFAFLTALAVWLGETIFLSFVVAPTLFRQFPAAEAGRVMSALFAGYYAVAYVCGIVLVALTALWWRRGAIWKWACALAAIMLIAALYAGLVVRPRVGELRLLRQDPAVAAGAEEEFDRLHRLSVQLNAVVLLGGLAIAGLTAARLRD